MRKITSSIIVSLILLSSSSFGASNLKEGVKEVGASIAEGMVKEGKKKIAIVEFSDLNDNVNDLGRFLAEKLINELIQNKGDKGYEIVERRQLNKVLKQLKLSSSGLLDPKSMKEVGKILNVDSIVTGSLTDLGNDIDVNARIISVESAKIIAVASTTIPKVGSVATLMGQNSVKVANNNTSSQSTTTHQTSKQSKKEKYSFENDEIFVKVTKAKKYPFGVAWHTILNVTIQNKTDKTLILKTSKKKNILSDDDGMIWTSYNDSLFDKGEVKIPPHRKVISKMDLIARGGKDGKKFDITLLYTVNDKDIEVNIYDIPVKSE